MLKKTVAGLKGPARSQGDMRQVGVVGLLSGKHEI